MTYERLSVRIDDGVGFLVLNKPDEYNRMPPAFWRELPAAVQSLDASGSVRAIVLSSTGKHFSAGLDISSFGGERGKPLEAGRAGEQAVRRLGAMQATISTIENARMPVIAAVQGGAVGGGVDLVSACDLRYCTKDAFFCIQEINIGLAADVGTLQRLPHLIPDGLMRELAYTGRRLHADEALAAGLVTRVFDARSCDNNRPHHRQQVATSNSLDQTSAELRARTLDRRNAAVSDGLDGRRQPGRRDGQTLQGQGRRQRGDV